MGWFKKKRNKNKNAHQSKDDWIPTDETISKPEKWVDNTVAKKKYETYQTPGVDEAIIRNVEDTVGVEVKKAPPASYPDRVPRQELKRPTDYKCPDCGNVLYNTKLDGLYFYCPKCKRQYHV